MEITLKKVDFFHVYYSLDLFSSFIVLYLTFWNDYSRPDSDTRIGNYKIFHQRQKAIIFEYMHYYTEIKYLFAAKHVQFSP